MARRKARKKFNTFKFVQEHFSLLMLLILGLIILLGWVATVFAGVETVKDDNDGNKGYILVNTGTKNGQSDVGHWTDPANLLLQGEPGPQGIQGEQGLHGIDGIDGKDGMNGIDGRDGAKGDQGDMGLPGAPGVEGEKGNTGDKGEQGIQGIKGVDFDPTTLNEQNSKLDSMSSRINKLERTQYVFQGEVRLFDTRKWTGKPFVRYNIQRHKVDTVGFILTYKIGKSYEERQMELLNKRLDRLEKEQPAVIEKFYNADGTLRQISIHE